MIKNKIGLKLLDDYLKKYENDTNFVYEKYGSLIGADLEKLEYNHQLEYKKEFIEKLLEDKNIFVKVENIYPSELIAGYRNKMEYSFGNEEIGGVLNLGMHLPKRHFDIVKVNDYIADDDFRKIVSNTEKFCRDNGYKEFHKKLKTGNLRNLSIRKSYYTKEILIAISTSSNDGIDIESIKKMLLNINDLDGKIVGIIHLVNDSIAEIVKKGNNDKILYGRDYFYEKLFNLTFKVSFFSFFQTNTRTAELLYSKVIEYLELCDRKDIVFDLFCGTGTISSVISKNVKKVIGVEIVEDAIEMANENIKINDINNVEFICGDVFNILDKLILKPDTIILDPPRSGLGIKTIKKLVNYECNNIIYVSCNPITFSIDLKEFLNCGYEIKKFEAVDLYPHTAHIEIIVLLSKLK